MAGFPAPLGVCFAPRPGAMMVPGAAGAHVGLAWLDAALRLSFGGGACRATVQRVGCEQGVR